MPIDEKNELLDAIQQRIVAAGDELLKYIQHQRSELLKDIDHARKLRVPTELPDFQEVIKYLDYAESHIVQLGKSPEQPVELVLTLPEEGLPSEGFRVMEPHKYSAIHIKPSPLARESVDLESVQQEYFKRGFKEAEAMYKGKL